MVVPKIYLPMQYHTVLLLSRHFVPRHSAENSVCMCVCVYVCMYARPQEHRHENMHGEDVTSKHEKHLPILKAQIQPQ